MLDKLISFVTTGLPRNKIF